jgi:hypothetical protein
MAIAKYNKACDLNVAGCVRLLLTESANIVSALQYGTITLTGSSGTANVALKTAVGGSSNYTATWNSTLTQTAADFVTTHAANILSAHAITVTSSGAALRFEGKIDNIIYGLTDWLLITNATLTLDGTVVSDTEISIDIFTMSGAERFQEIQWEQDQGGFSWEAKANGVAYTLPKIEGAFDKISKELMILLESLELAANCGSAAIVLDNNQNAWLFGYYVSNKYPLNIFENTGNSGKGLQDDEGNRVTVALSGNTKYKPALLNDTLTAIIIAGAGGSTWVTWN